MSSSAKTFRIAKIVKFVKNVLTWKKCPCHWPKKFSFSKMSFLKNKNVLTFSELSTLVFSLQRHKHKMSWVSEHIHTFQKGPIARSVLTFQNYSHLLKHLDLPNMCSLARSVLTFPNCPHVSVSPLVLPTFQERPHCLKMSNAVEQWHFTSRSNVSNQLVLSLKVVSKCDLVQLQPLNPVSGFGRPHEDSQLTK